MITRVQVAINKEIENHTMIRKQDVGRMKICQCFLTTIIRTSQKPVHRHSLCMCPCGLVAGRSVSVERQFSSVTLYLSDLSGYPRKPDLFCLLYSNHCKWGQMLKSLRTPIPSCSGEHYSWQDLPESGDWKSKCILARASVDRLNHWPTE